MNNAQLSAINKHKLPELISFFFKAKREQAKVEIMEKWIGAIRVSATEGESKNTKMWAYRIGMGSWETNKFGKKLFYKLGGNI